MELDREVERGKFVEKEQGSGVMWKGREEKRWVERSERGIKLNAEGLEMIQGGLSGGEHNEIFFPGQR